MSDKNSSSLCGALGFGSSRCDNATCIDVDKIYDSARDKDCIEDLKVFLNDCGQEIVDHATNVRVKCIELLWAHILVNNIAFNKGYYAVDIRFYFKICFEACIPGGKSQEFCGLAVFDKQSVLFGSEGNVSIFTSDPTNNDFCVDICDIKGEYKANTPKVVLEVADPIVLGVRIVEKTYKYGRCCCIPEQVPSGISRRCFENNICEGYGTKSLYVSIGLFSLIRMERPVSLLINAAEFCIPTKESVASADNDPCALFKSMTFPTCDFFPPGGKNPVGGRRCEKDC